MPWFRSTRPAAPDARVAAIRAARQRQGHDLTPLQDAMIRTIAACDPALDPDSHAALSRIEAAIAADGRWAEQEEWRISTWFDSTIVTSGATGQFTVTVACDGQSLSCGCPSLARAYGFMRFYQRLIVDQYYSVGPPWADQSLFQP